MPGLLLLLLLAGPARAEMFGAEYRTCEALAGDPAVMACLEARIKAWNQRMATALRELSKRIDKGQHAPLAEAQRAWVRFRDANCRFHEARDGSISKLHVLECRRAMTEARSEDIARTRTED